MLLHLHERHHVEHAVVRDDVDLEAPVAAAWVDVAVYNLVPVDTQILDRDILAPCAVLDADVWRLTPH